MLSILQGKRPDFTPAQVVATLVAGISVVSNLLSAFGVFTVSPAEQDALTNAVNWGVPFAGLLLGSDVAIRAARNHSDGKVAAAAAAQNGVVPPVGGAGVDAEEDASADIPESELPTDDEEFAVPPPADGVDIVEPAVRQPSQTGVAPVDDGPDSPPA